jgi:hypothetical protein
MTTQYTPNLGLALPDFRMGPWHDLVNNNMMLIDAILYSMLAKADIEVWTNTTHYPIGVNAMDIVDGTIWLCMVEHTSSNLPTTFAQDRTANPSWWIQMNFVLAKAESL